MSVKESITSAEDKVQTVLDGLKAGRSREQLAAELAYANYRSMDTMMRRHNFVWDSKKQMYYRPGEPLPIVSAPPILQANSKATKVVQLFEQGMDARLVAEKSGFSTYRDMANYMKEKGYVWDSMQNKYTLPEGQEPSDCCATRQSQQSQTSDAKNVTMDSSHNEEWQKYLPSLHWLEENIDALEARIAKTDGNHDNEEGIIPRYAVPGVFVTKSVHMSNQLDQIVRDFSAGRNISQRDIFAAALLEFLRKYGYKQEIDVFLAVH